MLLPNYLGSFRHTSLESITREANKHPCHCSLNPRILIVDDNIFNIVTLQTILEMNFNLSSDKSMNGQQAVDKVKSRLQFESPC